MKPLSQHFLKAVTKLTVVIIIGLVFAIAGCGGGGGGGDATTTPPPTSSTCVWDQSTSTWDNCTFGS
jgi:hypothetical protein